MSLISIAFALFCAVLLAVYYIIPARFRWIVLLAASMIFYAICGFKYIAYILVTATSVFAAALAMENLSVKRDAYLKESGGSLSREEKKAYKELVKNITTGLKK